MPKKYYLAIDIGASSGRHMLGYIQNKQIVLEEIHRFKNEVIRKDGKIIWDIELLLENIIIGMKKCKTSGKIPVSVGIDTFGVDYVLLDSEDQRSGEVYSYRDTRTEKSRKAFCQHLTIEQQFEISGLQPQLFNTIYQLYDDVQNNRLESVKSIMMLPSYLSFYLTGVKQNEYTIASTSGLINCQTKTWDKTLLNHLNIEEALFPKIVKPGYKIGNMKKAIQEEIGYDTNLYAVASHDTASSVLGSLTDEETIFLSSGTWSLIGILTDNPVVYPEVLSLGFTNEGSYLGKNRFLKNIMGLWMIQEVSNEQETPHTIQEIIKLSKKSADFKSIVNVNDERFLSPKSMMKTIKQVLKETSQPTPNKIGEYYYCIYHSLATEYSKAVQQIESIMGYTYKNINIIGGGSQNELLNELTRELSGKNIISGPTESTALGNVLIQMISNNEIKDIVEARNYVKTCLHI